jgi:hypothetical protein
MPFTVRLASTLGLLVSLFAVDAVAEPRFMDSDFAAQACNGWNATTLPDAVGRDGSGWIDSANSVGSQIIVVTRRECSGWTPVMFRIEANDEGRAMCTSAGAHDKKSFQWKFEPKTVHWADFTDGFGMGKMPAIMPGFVGPKGTAMKNLKNFEIFFAMVGHLALENDLNWSCTGADDKKVQSSIARIDHEDNLAILAGMDVLK